MKVILNYQLFTMLKLRSFIKKHKGKENKRELVEEDTINTFSNLMCSNIIFKSVFVNRVCWGSEAALRKTPIPVKHIKYIVPILGISTIPIITKPIDTFTECILDETVRKWF